MLHVTAALIHRGASMLVCRRRADVAHPLKWEFPGGKLEANESLAECMHRELDEELGIDALVGRLLWESRHEYPGQAAVQLSFFAIDSYRGVVENRVFAEIRWVPLATLGELDFLEGDREVVAALQDGRIAFES